MSKKQNAPLKLLELRPETDPILRKKCRKLTKSEILSPEIQDLIDNMKFTCDEKKYGVGLSAPQVGESVAISIIAIKPTPSRPHLEVFDKVCINAKILKTFGDKKPMWEGCISSKLDKNGEPAMAEVPRYEKVRISYFDRTGKRHEETVEGFIAHVVQHEIDHLNGVLFTDLVDPITIITNREYRQYFAQ